MQLTAQFPSFISLSVTSSTTSLNYFNWNMANSSFSLKIPENCFDGDAYKVLS